MRRRIPFPTDFPHPIPVDVSYVPRKRSPSAFLAGSSGRNLVKRLRASAIVRPIPEPRCLCRICLAGRWKRSRENISPPLPLLPVQVPQCWNPYLSHQTRAPIPSTLPTHPRGRVIRFVRRNPEVVRVPSRSPSPSRSRSPSYAGPPLLDDAFSRFGATALATGDQVRFLAYEFYHGSRDYAESMFERFKRRNNGRVRGFVHRRMEREVRYVKIPWGMSLERFLHVNYDLSSHSFHDYQSYILPTYLRWR